MSGAEKKRINIKLKSPNPLFEKWLEKWLEEAILKDSKAKFKIKQALESIRKYPLPLASGKDCAILRGFGPALCAMIDKELNEHHNVKDHPIEFNYNTNIQNAVKSFQKETVKTTLKSQKTTSVAKSKTLEEVDEQILMSPGTFKIILLVDTQETNGKTMKCLDDTRRYIESFKIDYEVRRLSIGDFLWICRDKNNHELVLPFIVERKRMDDFASSIRDGRFHEQKFRLRDSGITNLIYLIENYGNNQHVSLPMPTLMQAAVNTQVHSNFKIKFTDNHYDSMLYLNVLTKILIKQYKNKVLIGTNKEDLKSNDKDSQIVGLIKLVELQESSVKHKAAKVKDIFVRQLVQLKALSIENAFAIAEIYPTPKSLIDAYKITNSTQEAEELLTNIQVGQLKYRISSTLSKSIYNFYNTHF